MADNSSGGIGVLGVLIGALIVVVVGVGVLYATGNLGGGNKASVTITAPKMPTTGSATK